MDEQAKVSSSAKHAENKPLHNFTIPKIKRDTEKACLFHCTPNRREFSDIMDTINKERLNMGCELKSSWNFSNLKLVINNDLEQNFSEKRMEMKELGRHGRELEEKYCFLVVPYYVATAIAKHGLTIGNVATKVLGNPEMGVYLFRYIDVALNFAHRKNSASNVVVVFKVLCGKVKKINSNSAMKVALDPTPNFDSHVSKKAPLWNDPFDEQVTNSLIYMYEYDSNFRPVKTPRHCLPIALVDAAYIVQKPATSSGQVRLQPKFSSGNDSFASCTVAQRIGKGKDATIIFKSVRTKLLKPPEKEISQQKCSDEKAQAPPSPDIDLFSNIPMAPAVFQEQVTVPKRSAFHQPNFITLQNLLHSCMVITSKSMKDPRLLKRCEQEAPIPADQYPTCHQTQNHLHCESKVSNVKEKEASNENFMSCESIIKETSLYLSFEERRLSDNFMNKEQLMKKLKKYSSFLSLNKKERDAKVQSLRRLSNEEKAVLSRKLCTYDKYYKMFAHQLEITKVGENVKATLSAEEGSPTCSEAALPVSKSAYTIKGKENGHLPNKNNFAASGTDSGQGEGSPYMPQDTNQKDKVLAKTKHNIKENYTDESSLNRNHAVDKTAVNGKPKVFKTDQSPVTHVNSNRESPDIKKVSVHKAEAYSNNNSGPSDIKKGSNKVEKDFTAGLRVSDLDVTRIPDPPLPNQKVNCQKGEEKCILQKSPEKKTPRQSFHKGYASKDNVIKKTPKTSLKNITVIDQSDTSSTKGDKSDTSTSKCHANRRKGLDTKTTNEKQSFVLHSSYELDSGTSVKDLCKTDSSDSSLVNPPTQVSVCKASIDEDLVAKNLCLDKAIESPQSVELRGHKSAKDKFVDGGSKADDLHYLIELENRIDWKSIFGMEMEQINATVADLQNPPLRRQREPSGMRIFPDMEITVINCHYVCVDSCVSNLDGEMHPSMGDKEDLNETFESLKTVFLNCHESDIQVATVNVEDCKTSIEPNPESISSCMEVTKIIQSDDKDFPHNHHTLETMTDDKFASVKTLNTMKKRLNNKRKPSVLIKKSVRRINKFSQSEKNIKVVLGMLSDEIPLCKSKRISKKLNRAILHLRKAHKRVQKSLQIAAKAGERQNTPKTCNVQENENVKNRNVKGLKQSREISDMKQVESSKRESRSSQMIPTTNSKSMVATTNSKSNVMQKSLATNRKCLTESTEVINGVSTQDSPLAKSDSASAKQLSASSPFKSNICSPVTSEDHRDISSVTISNKENEVPAIYSSLKVSPGSKEICVESCETDGRDWKLHDTATRRKYQVCTKGIFSQIKSLSHAKKLPKCSKRMSNSSSEASQLTGQRKSIKEGAITKSVRMPSLLVKLSTILLKANKTRSLKSLQLCKLLCKQMLPVFIKSFEKKQQCVLKDVTVDRRLLCEQNLKTRFRCVLKPQAVEAFLELQMMMETDHFIENRMHYLEGRPTFRSLLWYDRSLYTELLKGESGYQQQSHFYTAFQNKMKLDASATLENYYAQLSEFLNAIHAQNSCYYVYLKYNRELKECEDVLKHDCDHPSFSLSVPFSCGVHLGDTIDDLAALQKSTLEIITTFLNLPKCDSGKKEHALCLLEIISAKIDFIKTSVTTSMQLSLFGIEHLLFDAAKMMFFRERKKCSGQKKLTLAKESIAQKNSFALSKLHEVYCIPSKATRFTEKQEENSNGILGCSQSQDVFFVGKIIDQARSANPSLLKQMTQVCKEQLEFQIKCFQLLQECDVNEVLIRESNVLEITDRQDLLPTLLKTEAIEAYIELVMVYETLHFLNCMMSSHKHQKRSRGLLWYDNSLLSDLLCNQNRLVSCLQEDLAPNVIDIIDSTITEIKSELEVICDCTNSVNFSYAFQIMTRELSELSELKSFVLKSKSAVSTYIHFSPYTASLHLGNSSTELDYNYKQLSDYLDSLVSMPKKDLGKMAHTMKIMKTIELAKVFVLKADQSAVDIFTCQILQNRKKHDEDTVKKIQKKSLLNDQSPRKRTCNGTSAESTTSFTPKKQKVIKCSGKSSEKKRVESRVKSNLRAKSPNGLSTTVLQSPVKKRHTKDSRQKESKALAFSSQKCKRQEYVKDIGTASEISKRSEDDSKSNPSSPQGFINRSQSFFSLVKSPEAPVLQDMHSKQQDMPVSTCIVSPCPESVISTGPDLENISEPSDAHTIKLKEESLRKKDTFSAQLSSNNSVTSMDECSVDTNTSEEPKDQDQAKPVTEAEGKQGSNSQTDLVPHKSHEWNSQPMPPVSSPYPQYPGSANPWQYSLYLWYQNTNNANVMAQGYHGVSYNTQQANPYNQASAFPVLQNSYTTSQQYANYPSQMSAQMYPSSGPFGANMPYCYTDRSSASEPNSVPNSYAYSSGASSGWPWSSWQ